MSEDKWVSIDTGGGCAALLWEFEAHGRPFYVMLTDEGGMHRPDADDWMHRQLYSPRSAAPVRRSSLGRLATPCAR